MNYFVTGATGFIGSHLIEKLLQRDGKIYVLVREQSLAKIDELKYQLRATEGDIIPVIGDLAQPLLGISDSDIDNLNGNIGGFFHLGAIYDLAADEQAQLTANVEGTRHAMQLAEKIRAECFHHTSSIVVGGFYPGTFTEEMFSEAVGVEANPYFRTKHISEGVVRDECSIPYRIYRPSAVVGHSKTGRMGKVDGPYYFFPALDRVSEILPRWTPLPMIKGPEFNLVPVDFVVDAMDHIAHQPGLDGKCFHLTDPAALSLGETMNLFLKAAKGPTLSLDIPIARLKELLPEGVSGFLEDKATVDLFKERLLENYNIPKQVAVIAELTTSYDCSNTTKALQGSNIAVPPLKNYATVLWQHWERYLHPKLALPQNLEQAVKGQVIVITGGSEGIGKQVADDVSAAGATVVLVARSEDKLRLAVDDIRSRGGDAHGLSCDLNDFDACDQVITDILTKFGHIDVLVNNAGRSIRRSLSNTYDRFHDFERVMRLNYFSCVRLVMAALPSMVAHGRGKVINVSSMAVLGQASPRFSAYVASKSALDVWSRTAAVEYQDSNISFTNVHMPLVRTAMIAATDSYKSVSTMPIEDASELVTSAMINPAVEVNPLPGELMRLVSSYAPKLMNLLLATTYQVTQDSAAAMAGIKAAESAPGQDDAQTLASVGKVLKGMHT